MPTPPPPSVTPLAGRRADAGTVKLTGRDITGLMLSADHYGAPYDLPAPRGAVLYSPRSGQRLEDISLDLMAYLDLKGEGESSMPGNRQHMPRRMGWRAGRSA